MTKYFRNFLIIMVLTIVAVVVYNIATIESKPPTISYSSFLNSLKNKEIKSVLIRGGEIVGQDIYDQSFYTFSPEIAPIINKLEAQGVTITTAPGKSSSGSLFSSFLPWFMILAGLIFFVFSQQKGDGSPFSKDKGIIAPAKALKITFKDVAGIPEAKDELEEIISLLRDSKKFTRLGGRLPKGVLLQGPPGTGKTLLAKAIAGEAGVPFFSISGSDFVEMFVGVGASRVRELFKQAKKNAPCIIFIDEIDAVGGHRAGASSAGGQDERQQTLNALLVEMDGFQSGETVVIVAATNRPDTLDPALLRPGRFDRMVTILPPDIKGRQEILEVYARNITMAENVQLKNIAGATPGFTGADLANLMNESALLAARMKKNAVDLEDIENAKDKIMMGTERKGMVISKEERRITAYHEAGHAIMARLLPNTDPLHKITIIPRGQALGMTQQIPLDDRHSYSKEYLTNRIKIMLGGRTAEEIIFNQFTTGASNDLQSATAIATRMICQWGMSDHLGPRAYTKDDEGFLGSNSEKLLYSDETAMAIDKEINSLIEDCYQEAMIILEGRIGYLHKLAEVLLEKETIGPEDVDKIIPDNPSHEYS
ncbi:MAG: ATP-dependent zinc metalloprotease FtsH [Proteobacteria bacterium]|nr:ATP-dependent zinc metalloprotease FtsH [Pseudomonadota bacterium]MBU1717126.1 ATP-dependent zinc metalloprotease FtsH [Pseudomonadota bacterium]